MAKPPPRDKSENVTPRSSLCVIRATPARYHHRWLESRLAGLVTPPQFNTYATFTLVDTEKEPSLSAYIRDTRHFVENVFTTSTYMSPWIGDTQATLSDEA